MPQGYSLVPQPTVTLGLAIHIAHVVLLPFLVEQFSLFGFGASKALLLVLSLSHQCPLLCVQDHGRVVLSELPVQARSAASS